MLPRLTRHLALPACALLISSAAELSAQTVSADGLWQDMGDGATFATAQKAAMTKTPWVQPAKCRVFGLTFDGMKAQLANAGSESQGAAAITPLITLPLPDGSYQRFKVVESPVMEPDLAKKFPEIKTYQAVGIDDPLAVARLDSTPRGFHAQILRPDGAVYIDPYWKDDTTAYASYAPTDNLPDKAWSCGVADTAGMVKTIAGTLSTPKPLAATGGTQRTYRLACAATGEYTAFHGGTVTAGLSAITTSINRVTGIYQKEVSVRLVLVANNNLLVYTNSSTDPYSNGTPSSLLSQNQSTCDSVIGSANYDIGHVFSTAGGGLAGVGVVCSTGNKAKGETGTSSPVGDAFDVDYVAHEIGHQFSAMHTFNGVTSNCSGSNRSASDAYEPGSGTTILAYAGICGADNLQAHSDPYFHFNSIAEITSLITSTSCAQQTATANVAPTVNGGPDYTIPAQTPFALTATGSDANGDAITYCWEERDLGAAQLVTAGDNGTSPIFRSFNPTTSGTRTFPKLSALLANTSSLGETLPTTNRTLKFRVMVRDNNATAGATNTDDVNLTVVNTGAAFQVTAPNTAVTWAGVRTVTWNIAGTTGSGINAANVDILLSTDGGNTFPVTLVAGTPNDGSQAVLLPNIATSSARIKVQPVGNVFFDLSNANFSIVTLVKADLDLDGDVDDADYALFEACYSSADTPSVCTNARMDADTDVDQTDFGIFQRCFSGSGNLPLSNCAN